MKTMFGFFWTCASPTGRPNHHGHTQEDHLNPVMHSGGRAHALKQGSGVCGLFFSDGIVSILFLG
jgi:hypothetical protein